MITAKHNEKAKEIRHEASLKHGYPVYGDEGINRPACVGMAMKGEELPWKNKAVATTVLVKVARNGENVTVENRRVWVGKTYIGESFSPLNAARKKEFPGMEWICGGRLLLSSAEKEMAEKAIAEQDQALAEKNRRAQEETERGCEKIRALVTSGRFLLDEEIMTMYVLNDEDQKKYIAELQGSMVRPSCSGPENFGIEIKNSPTAQKIVAGKPSKYYMPGESVIWIITPEDEKAILAECAIAKEIRDAKAKIEAEKEAKIEAEKAKKYAEMIEKHPDRAGKSQCWECGCWSSFLDKEGYCGC